MKYFFRILISSPGVFGSAKNKIRYDIFIKVSLLYIHDTYRYTMLKHAQNRSINEL